jgi:hypothetical protein
MRLSSWTSPRGDRAKQLSHLYNNYSHIYIPFTLTLIYPFILTFIYHLLSNLYTIYSHIYIPFTLAFMEGKHVLSYLHYCLITSLKISGF